MPSPSAPQLSTPGLILAAPASGSGKTSVTLALLRRLANRGTAVSSAKVGPDYIDPRFHAAASGRPCINLDPWAMTSGQLQALAAKQCQDSDLLIIEGVMGLFDGAADGTGSTADLAARLRLPVILVVDAASQSQSIAALVSGFANHRPDCRVAGIILNKVGSPRHDRLLRRALAPLELPIIGSVARQSDLSLPSRHLGLVQAEEQADLEAYLNQAAERLAGDLDLDLLQSLAQPPSLTDSAETSLCLPPPGQRVAIARDRAFAFAYPHLLADWQEAGAELSFFSPLADDAPDAKSDALFLPGGYPELQAGKLAGNRRFLSGLKEAAGRGTLIYGECGGFMTLGEGLIDAEGGRHEMAGLLPLTTSFATRKLHLGYRKLSPLPGTPWLDGSDQRAQLRGHEFHYASIVEEAVGPGQAERLFDTCDAEDQSLGLSGLRVGRVMGSYQHLIAQ
ncbi:cobyrinate a,c-diamide synthase [Rhodovibrionaceae bacterium A322]